MIFNIIIFERGIIPVELQNCEIFENVEAYILNFLLDFYKLDCLIYKVYKYVSPGVGV